MLSGRHIHCPKNIIRSSVRRFHTINICLPTGIVPFPRFPLPAVFSFLDGTSLFIMGIAKCISLARVFQMEGAKIRALSFVTEPLRQDTLQNIDFSGRRRRGPWKSIGPRRKENQSVRSVTHANHPSNPKGDDHDPTVVALEKKPPQGCSRLGHARTLVGPRFRGGQGKRRGLDGLYHLRQLQPHADVRSAVQSPRQSRHQD